MMNLTEKLKEKYPQYVIGTVRQRLGLEANDNSMDERILNMTNSQVFGHVVSWNGLLGGYDERIKGWVSNIYGIELDEL